MLLRTTKDLDSYSLQARDGTLGRVTDFFFDDHHWHIRYAVVQTRNWLSGRRVLISPVVMGAADPDARKIPVDLTMDQARHSPDVGTNKPVSRQREGELRNYYGWAGYWDGALGPGGLIAPIPPSAPGVRDVALNDGDAPLKARGDPALRSCDDTRGYKIAATDGEVGHVEDFLIDDTHWKIAYLLVDTRNWWPGRKVIVEPEWILCVSWTNANVTVDLTREAIKTSPPYEPSMPWSEAHAIDLRKHYGKGERVEPLRR